MEDFVIPTASMEKPRRSISFPLELVSRKSLSYSKLPEEPIKLHVLKLDGSSFGTNHLIYFSASWLDPLIENNFNGFGFAGIQVKSSATIADLKLAVKNVFSDMPKTGPGKISWYEYVLRLSQPFPHFLDKLISAFLHDHGGRMSGDIFACAMMVRSWSQKLTIS